MLQLSASLKIEAGVCNSLHFYIFSIIVDNATADRKLPKMIILPVKYISDVCIGRSCGSPITNIVMTIIITKMLTSKLTKIFFNVFINNKYYKN